MAELKWSDLVAANAAAAPRWSDLVAANESLAEPPEPPPPPKDRTRGEFAKDMLVKGAQGVVDLGQSVVGLGDLATGGLIGKGAEAIGYDAKRASDMLQQFSSDKQKRMEAEIARAGEGKGIIDGFVDSVKALADNPSAIPGYVMESLPSMMAAGGGARALGQRIYLNAGGGAAGAKAVEAAAGSLKWAAAAGEGALSAGQIADEARAAKRTWSEYVLPALGAGTGVALVGRAAGAIPGLGDAETAAFTGVGKGVAATGNRLMRTAKGALQEGPLEELPQSVIEQSMSNVAQDKPIEEGLGAAAAQGLVTGTAMGGALGALTRGAVTPSPKTDLERKINDFLFETVGNRGNTTGQIDFDALKQPVPTYKDFTPEQIVEQQTRLEKGLAGGIVRLDAEGNETPDGVPHYQGAPIRAVAPQDLPTEGDETALTRDKYEVLAALNKALGKDLVVFEAHSKLPMDGFVEDGDTKTVFIASTAKVDPAVIAKHELQHVSEQGELQAAYAKVVEEELTGNAMAIAKARHGAELSDTKLLQEVRGDITGDAWADPTFHGRVLTKMREQLGDKAAEQTGTAFLQSLGELVAKFKAILTGTTYTTKEGKRLATEYVNNLERVHDALAAAMADQFVREGYRPPGAMTNQSKLLVTRAETVAANNRELEARQRQINRTPPAMRTAEDRIALRAKPMPPVEVPQGASPALRAALKVIAAKTPFNRTPREAENVRLLAAGIRMSPKRAALDLQRELEAINLEVEMLKNVPKIADDDAFVKAWQQIATHDAAFRYKKTNAKSVADITKELAPDAEVVKTTDISSNIVGAWYINFPNAEPVMIKHYHSGEVELDASSGKPAGIAEGRERGVAYQIAATYAHNNGLVFTGDRNGVSAVAVRRRVEHLISSALRFGTTRHLRPGPEVEEARRYEFDGSITELPVRPVVWTVGNDTKNLRELLLTNAENIATAVPATKQISYNFDRGYFEDNTGYPISDAEFQRLASSPAGRAAAAGSGTLKRAILSRALLSEAGRGKSGLLVDEGAGGTKTTRLPGVLAGVLLSPKEEKKAKVAAEVEKARGGLTANLSAATSSIAGLKKLQDRANAGDEAASVLLNQVARNALTQLTSGIDSVRVEYDDNRGLYFGELEPSIGARVTFDEADRGGVLAALAKFADNYNQHQIHVRQETNMPVGHVFEDGSFATDVARFNLRRPMSREEVQKVITDSGLVGMTINTNYLEAYFAGNPENVSERDKFKASVAKAYQSLDGNVSTVDRSVSRLWRYGKPLYAGDRPIGYSAISGLVRPRPAQGNETARLIARDLTGNDVVPGEQRDITPAQRAKQQQIARDYEALPLNDLDNPDVRRAYSEAAMELRQQFEALPIKVEVLTGQGEPYKNSREMRDDVANNNHLYIYGTEVGTFGPPGVVYDNHPLLADSGLTDVNGRPLLANDLLRAVHDYYAHTITPVQFGPKGEEAAWKTHMSVTKSPWARWAIASETRGQNSWVNFRDGADAVPVKDRPFAEQKVGLLPIKHTLTGNATVDKPVLALRRELGDARVNGSLGIRMSAKEETPPFYSPLMRQIEGAKMNTAPATQWQAFVKSLLNKGVKKDEIEASGVMEWLDTQSREFAIDDYIGVLNETHGWERIGNMRRPIWTDEDLTPEELAKLNVLRNTPDNKGKATKQELLDYLRLKGTKVETIMLGEPDAPGTDIIQSEYAQGVDDDEVDRLAERLWDADAESRYEINLESARDSDYGRFEVKLMAPNYAIVPLPADLLRGDAQFGVQKLEYEDEVDEVDDVEDLGEPMRSWATEEQFADFDSARRWAQLNIEDAAPDGMPPYFVGVFPEAGDATDAYDTREEANNEAKKMADRIAESDARSMTDDESFGNSGDADTSYYMERAREQLEGERSEKRNTVRHRDRYQSEGGRGYREMILSVPNIESYNEDDDTHFGTDTEGRTVAWSRFKVHKDNSGTPTLFLEEVQSQRAQHGKAQGFRESDGKVFAELKKLQAEIGEADMARDAATSLQQKAAGDMDYWKQKIAKTLQPTAAFSYLQFNESDMAKFNAALENSAEFTAANAAYNAAVAKADAAYDRAEAINTRMDAFKRNKSRVPPAPFVKDTQSWVGLTLKRLLRYAVDKGITQVAWTTGAQNAMRYGTKDKIDGLTWEKVEGGVKINAVKDGKIVVDRKMDADELGLTIGRSVARGIIEDPSQSGEIPAAELDLINGLGMQSFYGDAQGLDPKGKPAILPLVADKLVKSMGGKGVEVIDIDVDEERDTYEGAAGFKINDAMREKVMAGMPLFSRKQETTPGFKKWFGDSKVVDADGKPLVMYHGGFDATNSKTGAFNVNGTGALGVGAYFTPGPMMAVEYMRDDSSAMTEAYISLQNPLIIRQERGVGHPVVQGLMKLGMEEEAARRMVEKTEERNGYISTQLKTRGQAKGHDGIIEYVRNQETGEWMIGEVVAWRPNQIKAITNTSPTYNPSILKSPKQVTIGASLRTYTPEQQRMHRNIGRTVDIPSWQDKLALLRKDFGKKMAQGLFDQFRPLKDIDSQAYLLARLSKGTAGALEALMNYGKLKLTGNVYDADMTGGFVQRVGVPLHGEMNDFLTWVASNRAARLKGDNRERLFTDADIAAGRTLAEGTTTFEYTLQHGPRKGQTTTSRKDIFNDALMTFNEFNKNALDMAEQSGLIDKDARKTWESEFYVPFYRVSEEDGAFMGNKVGDQLVRQRAFKTLKGGTDKLNSDLLTNTLQNWAHLIDSAAKNRAAKAALVAAEKMGGAIEANESTVRSMGAAAGMKNNIVWFADNGKERYFLVEDPMLMTALTALDYAGMRNPVMDAMSTLKHWLTVGVTASPAFKMRNLIRDSMQAIAASPISGNIATNMMQGIEASRRDSQTFVSALASGGLIRFGTMLENRMADRIRQLVKQGVKDSTILDSESKIQAFYDKYLEPAWQNYQELGNRSEEITRSALYKQMIDKGMSHAEASLLARDLMDFSMQGSFTSVRFLTQVVPFLNARMQGLYKLGRAAEEDPKRMAVVIAALSVASIALLAAYGDDDEWKKREDWDRDNFWWFKLGGVAFRIPKPFEVGAVATLAERTFELAFDKEMTGKRYRDRVLHLLSDNLSMNPVPQAVKPIVDVYSNKDWFSGRPIESMGMERLRPDYRFTANTSLLARGVSTAGQAAAGVVGGNFLSPVQIDHMLRGYFGWLGATSVWAADTLVMRPLSNEPTQPAADMWKLATAGFFSELPANQSRYVTHMYDQAEKVEQAYSTWRQLLKQGKVDDAREFLEDNRQAITNYKVIGSVKRAEAKFNERIRIIERSNLSPAVKKEQIALIRAQADRVARIVQ